MDDVFACWEVTVPKLGWLRDDRRICRALEDACRCSGAVVLGVWAAQIGLERDRGLVLAAYPHLESARIAVNTLADAAPDLAADTPVLMMATARPERLRPEREGGFYAHRWFELASADWDEFLDLSVRAWPSMEAAVEARICGFWRAIESGPADGTRPSATTRVLLLTHYRTLDDWERSRWWGRPDPGATEAMARFRRRAELVVRTRVVITTVPAVWRGTE